LQGASSIGNSRTGLFCKKEETSIKVMCVPALYTITKGFKKYSENCQGKDCKEPSDLFKYAYCGHSDYEICQSIIPAPSPPSPPTLPPTPPKIPTSPTKPLPAPPPAPPSMPPFPTFPAGEPIGQCIDKNSPTYCTLKKSKHQCSKRSVYMDCALTCGLTCTTKGTVYIPSVVVNPVVYNLPPFPPLPPLTVAGPCIDQKSEDKCTKKKLKGKCYLKSIYTQCPKTCGMSTCDHMGRLVIGR